MDSTDTTKTLFNVNSKDFLGFLDEAWMAPNKIAPNPKVIYAHYIDMGSKVIGTSNETVIKMVVNPKTGEVIIAYPVMKAELTALLGN